MLTADIDTAINRARSEFLPGDGIWYAEIPELPGVWADGLSEEACLQRLREVLEDWVMLRLAQQLPLPAIDAHDSSTPAG
ncbi:type II toxin-antitoxin system HicB family antitoxin [Thermomicrobiaceae bacterium CFH 74404]|uniref:Type II toxin-antitoxin system HicB family antitoxin n=1 Tax=Thermalbibacter longus TaxID=2951981 RepID=A0AA41WH81_9BACT|nr:type II toxin-antitoxin system HicB family antitoxin [Thermalbibacter longus]MCM8749361.1 type II toxin-antitoxin system HicB family antitoxin [Thermalbibacter longus]